MKVIIFAVLCFPYILFSQYKVLVESDVAYSRFDIQESLNTSVFSSIGVSAGVRLKNSFDCLFHVSYLQNHELRSKFGKKSESLILGLNLRYSFLKNYIVRPCFQLDIGSVVHTNMKNQIIRERLELLNYDPPEITPVYNSQIPYYLTYYEKFNKFKNWGPIITPKALVMIDLKHINILAGVEYTFLHYKVEDFGFYNKPSVPAVTKKMVSKGLGFTGGIIYKF
jgi:hypothetical protein